MILQDLNVQSSKIFTDIANSYWASWKDPVWFYQLSKDSECWSSWGTNLRHPVLQTGTLPIELTRSWATWRSNQLQMPQQRQHPHPQLFKDPDCCSGWGANPWHPTLQSGVLLTELAIPAPPPLASYSQASFSYRTCLKAIHILKEYLFPEALNHATHLMNKPCDCILSAGPEMWRQRNRLIIGIMVTNCYGPVMVFWHLSELKVIP